MRDIRHLVATIGSYGYEDNINGLNALKEILTYICSSDEAFDEVVKEVDKRIDFIKLYNAPGFKHCQKCHGHGCGYDGRGDPWTCYNCKPELKNFWKDDEELL